MNKTETWHFDCHTRTLELQICKYGVDSIEIELINRSYNQQRHQKLKHLCILIILYGLYYYLGNIAARYGLKLLQKTLVADLGFVISSLYYMLTLFKLVKKEKLLYCHDVAMQLKTEFFWTRSSSALISVINIYDICINEVIENIDIHYMLLIRTKGHLFKEKPIIPLFNVLKPPIDCLALIHKYLKAMHMRG